MSRIYFIFLMVLFLFFSLQIPAAQKKEETEEYKLLVAEIKKTIDYDSLMEVLRKFNMDLMKAAKDGKMLKSREYSLYSTRIKIWLKYQWFIADTGISKEWLKGVKDLVDYMLKMRNFIETSRYNGSTENAKYEQAVKYYDVAYKRFVAKISKPEKVSLKIQRQLKVEKVKWQKAMAKKYKIKENF